MEMPAEVGLYPDVSPADYRAWPAINHSALCHARRSMMHMRWAIDHPKEPSDAMSFGELAHSYILEPEAMLERYVSYEKIPWNTKEGREQKAAVLAAVACGKRPITSEELLACRLMRHQVLSHPRAYDLLVANGVTELSVLWREPTTGVVCKCRLDRWIGDERIIVDLKTSRNAAHRSFGRDAAMYGYHIQAAFYQDAIKAVIGASARMLLIVVENEPPYAVAVYQFDAEAEAAGRQFYQTALEEYRDSLRLDRWTGYPDDVQILSLPRWALPQQAFDMELEEF